jgi:hypothetical protein
MLNGKKILVVEDEKDTLVLLAEGLRRLDLKSKLPLTVKMLSRRSKILCLI